MTFVETHRGWVYVAFIIDVFSRLIVCWQISTSLRTNLAIDALEMAIYARNGNDLLNIVHPSHRGVQYLSIRYSERHNEAEILASVGSKSDSYDNALAESFNGFYKTELIHRRGPWSNSHRIHESLDYLPLVEFEGHNYRSNESESLTVLK
jgi:putative transposase